jgi:hypothetical protein
VEESETLPAPNTDTPSPLEASGEPALWTIYLDETGDFGMTRYRTLDPNLAKGPVQGVSGPSSRHFAIAGILAAPQTHAGHLRAWSEMIERTKPGKEQMEKRQKTFSWKGAPRRIHDDATSTLHAMNSSFLFAAVASKPLLRCVGRRHADPIYFGALEMLLVSVSQFAKAEQVIVRVVVAHRNDYPQEKIASHIRWLKGRGDRGDIAWEHFLLPIEVRLPSDERMLQVADTVCGIVSSAFEPDWTAQRNTEYLEVVRDKFWRVDACSLLDTSIGVGPVCPEFFLEHGWLKPFAE